MENLNMLHGKLIHLTITPTKLRHLVADKDITAHPACYREILKEEIESCYTYSGLVEVARYTLNDYLTRLNYPTEIKNYIKAEFRKTFKHEFFQQLNAWERKHAPTVFTKDDGWYRLYWEVTCH